MWDLLAHDFSSFMYASLVVVAKTVRRVTQPDADTRVAYVEVERELLRNNGLTFSLIKNEYIYINLKHKNRK